MAAFKQNDAPTSPSSGDVWIDTSDSTVTVVKIYAGTSWEEVSRYGNGAIGYNGTSSDDVWHDQYVRQTGTETDSLTESMILQDDNLTKQDTLKVQKVEADEDVVKSQVQTSMSAFEGGAGWNVQASSTLDNVSNTPETHASIVMTVHGDSVPSSSFIVSNFPGTTDNIIGPFAANNSAAQSAAQLAETMTIAVPTWNFSVTGMTITATNSEPGSITTPAPAFTSPGPQTLTFTFTNGGEAGDVPVVNNPGSTLLVNSGNITLGYEPKGGGSAKSSKELVLDGDGPRAISYTVTGDDNKSDPTYAKASRDASLTTKGWLENDSDLPVVFLQVNQPEEAKEKDIWFDSLSGTLKVLNGSVWVASRNNIPEAPSNDGGYVLNVSGTTLSWLNVANAIEALSDVNKVSALKSLAEAFASDADKDSVVASIGAERRISEMTSTEKATAIKALTSLDTEADKDTVRGNLSAMQDPVNMTNAEKMTAVQALLDAYYSGTETDRGTFREFIGAQKTIDTLTDSEKNDARNDLVVQKEISELTAVEKSAAVANLGAQSAITSSLSNDDKETLRSNLSAQEKVSELSGSEKETLRSDLDVQKTIDESNAAGIMDTLDAQYRIAPLPSDEGYYSVKVIEAVNATRLPDNILEPSEGTASPHVRIINGFDLEFEVRKGAITEATVQGYFPAGITLTVNGTDYTTTSNARLEGGAVNSGFDDIIINIMPGATNIEDAVITSIATTDVARRTSFRDSGPIYVEGRRPTTAKTLTNSTNQNIELGTQEYKFGDEGYLVYEGTGTANPYKFKNISNKRLLVSATYGGAFNNNSDGSRAMWIRIQDTTEAETEAGLVDGGRLGACYFPASNDNIPTVVSGSGHLVLEPGKSFRIFAWQDSGVDLEINNANIGAPEGALGAVRVTVEAILG